MNCPLPRYWMCHMLVATIIALVLWPLVGLIAGATAGGFFYIGREFTQKEQGGGPGLPFDWYGCLAPVLSSAAIIILVMVLR